MDPKQNYLLAIESAVTGGSIAVFAGGELMDCWVGSGGTSRAEDLLAAVDEVCTRTIGGTSKLNKIAVSVGPGSFTGLRIGISSAMGLAKGIGIECVGVSVLDAMAFFGQGPARTIAAIPMGKADICYKKFGFEDNDDSVIRSVSRETFVGILAGAEDAKIIVPRSLIGLPHPRITDAGECIARHIGSSAASQQMVSGLNPIYVKNPRLS